MADGSVTIEITGDPSEFISTLNRTAGEAASRFESAFSRINDTISDTANRTSRDFGGSIDDVVDQVNNLGDSLSDIDGDDLDSLRDSSDETRESLDDLGDSTDEVGDDLDELGDSADDAGDNLDDLVDSADDAGRSTRKFGDIFKGTFLGGLAVKGVELAVQAIANLGEKIIEVGKQAIESYAQYEQLVGGVDTLFKESSQTVQQYAANAYKTAGMSANQYMETVTSFSASLISSLGGDTAAAAEMANVAITDMSDNANKMGTAIGDIQYAYQGFAKQNYTMLDNLKLGYGGTQEEMIRLINDSGVLNEKIESLDGISFDTIISAIHEVQTQIGITGTTAAEASSTIEGSINSVKGAWDNLLVGLVANDPDIGGLIDNLGVSIETAAGNLWPAIQNLVTNVASRLPDLASTFGQYIPTLVINIGKFLLSTVNVLSEVAAELMQGLAEGIVNKLSSLGSTISEAFTPAVESLKEMAGNAVEQVVVPFTSLPVKISTALLNAANRVATWASETASKMKEGARNAIDGAVSFFQQLPGKISSFLTNALNSIATWATNTATKARETGSNVLSAISTFFSQIPGRVASSLSGALSSLISWGAQMVSNARAKMAEVAQSIKAKLSSLPGQMLSIGSNIIQGLINGISQKARALFAKAQAIADGIKSRIKSALNINSPSKWAIEIGGYVTEGLAIGLDRKADLANKAIGNITNGIKGAVTGLYDQLSRIQEDASRRAAEKEKAQYEKQIQEKYNALGEAEEEGKQKILDEIADMQEDWNEKQLQSQENAAKELLNSQISALEKLSNEYERSLNDLLSSVEKMANEIGEVDLFGEDDSGKVELFNLQDNIDAITAYGDAIEALKSRGISESLFGEVLDMDMEDATKYANALLNMTDEQYDEYIALWEEKERAAQEVAQKVYSEDFSDLQKQYKEQLNNLPQDMGDIGGDAMDALNEALKERGGATVDTMRSIADDIIAETERINAAAMLREAVSVAVEDVSISLAKSTGEASARSRAKQSDQASQYANLMELMNATDRSQEIVLTLNGREMARAMIDDIRAVEDQSPRIVSD